MLPQTSSSQFGFTAVDEVPGVEGRLLVVGRGDFPPPTKLSKSSGTDTDGVVPFTGIELLSSILWESRRY